MYGILAISPNEALDTQRGGIFFFPCKFTLESYAIILKTPSLLNAGSMTLARTLVGMMLAVFSSAMLPTRFRARTLCCSRP